MNLLYFLDGFVVGVLTAALFWKNINIIDTLFIISSLFLGRLFVSLITKQVTQN
jgi:Ca2+/Na+ antiporter